MSEPQRPHYEPWTPVQVERKLAELMNEVASAEIAMRKLLETESDAKWEYERAHVIASTDPNCPIPTRGGATVGERDSWIRGVVQDEFRGLEYASLNVTIQKRYLVRLEQQTSICQTMARMALAAYNIVGSRGTGGV